MFIYDTIYSDRFWQNDSIVYNRMASPIIIVCGIIIVAMKKKKNISRVSLNSNLNLNFKRVARVTAAANGGKYSFFLRVRLNIYKLCSKFPLWRYQYCRCYSPRCSFNMGNFVSQLVRCCQFQSASGSMQMLKLKNEKQKDIKSKSSNMD